MFIAGGSVKEINISKLYLWDLSRTAIVYFNFCHAHHKDTFVAKLIKHLH